MGSVPCAVEAQRVEPVLIDLDAEAGAFGDADIAVFDFERSLENADAEIGMVGHTGVLLRKQVRHAGVELHAGGKRDGAEGIVRRDLHIVGLSHSRDLTRLKYAAAVAEVGLDDGDGLLLNKLAEAELREQTLAGRDGYRRAA